MSMENIENAETKGADMAEQTEQNVLDFALTPDEVRELNE